MVPKLYSIAIPIFNINNIGTKYEFRDNSSTRIHSTTAITIYMVISLWAKSMVSSSMALMPPTLQVSLVISLTFVTAFNVVSADVASLYVISIISLLSLLNLLRISVGKILAGISVPRTSYPVITLATPSISLILSSSFKISLALIFSNTVTEKAPMLKSSAKIFWPFIVSISSGKYTKIL